MSGLKNQEWNQDKDLTVAHQQFKLWRTSWQAMTGRANPTHCFCTSHELRMILTRLNHWKKIFLKRIFYENWEIHEVQILPIVKLDWNTVMPFCLYIVNGFFHSTKMSSCGTDQVAQKASNVWNLALYRKGLTDPWIYLSQRPKRTDSYCCLGGFLFCFILPM